MAKHWIQEWLDWLSAVPIPSRCPITGLLHCERKDCRYYLYSDDARDLGERCAHPDAVAAVVDPRQRELDFHAAATAGNWHRAEQLTLAALQDRDLSDAERYAWRERRDAARRGLARG